MEEKRKHPKFLRPNYGRSKRKRIKKNWRAPRGVDNKKREKVGYMGKSPSIGYGSPRSIRGFHPSGKEELLVSRPEMLKEATGKVVRISATVGGKKREEIRKTAKDMGLRVLN